MHSAADVLSLIAADQWMMAVLTTVRDLDLPDSWIGAGFVRGKVWDRLHGYDQATPLNDIDVLYFQPSDQSDASERAIGAQLQSVMPKEPWSAKNQARMHRRNGDAPYADTTDAIRHWLETPTCVAVQLRTNGELQLTAPFGVDDLLGLIIRPTPAGRHRAADYRARLESKAWLRNWPKTQAIWP